MGKRLWRAREVGREGQVNVPKTFTDDAEVEDVSEGRHPRI